ncbi:uncharacterized protein LOC125507002 [Triticum urartu]|uniref:uncharacterized protein LOC125507002 n=1 Tax=Triticum urartu TaxID=4572 RepID=UPI00204422F9|nr:uncharacterized protein LOC125507002 [Triticum urartu]
MTQRLPDSFMNMLMGEDPPNNVKLRQADSGFRRLWDVELVIKEGHMYLSRGWEKFYRAYDLRLGYFLLFRYDDDATMLIVKVFNVTMCRMRYAEDYDAGGAMVSEAAGVAMESHGGGGSNPSGSSQYAGEPTAFVPTPERPVLRLNSKLSRACKQPDTRTTLENATAKHMDHSKNCDHGLAEIEALLRREQELVTQLRALILPQLHNVDSGSAELAAQLFDDVIGCSTSVVSKLFTAGSGATIELIDDKSLVRKKSPSTAAAAAIDDKMDEQAKPSCIVGRKRRRNDGKRSRSLVTNVPHYDGHQWRKYGQKNINGRQHARSYYRCTYTERNCSATKTVQQQDRDGGGSIYSADAGEDQGAKYTVVYYGDHTCKAGDNISNNIIDHLPNLVDIDLRRGETERVTAEISEFDMELDVPALLEVFNNSQLNWEIVC